MAGAAVLVRHVRARRAVLRRAARPGLFTIQLVHDELHDLEQRPLIALAARIGGIESYTPRPPHRGRSTEDYKHDGRTSASARLLAGTRWSTGVTRKTRLA